MKPWSLANVLSRLAETLGFDEQLAAATSPLIEVPGRRPNDIDAALVAAKRLRAHARKLKLDVTRDEILGWVKQGRR